MPVTVVTGQISVFEKSIGGFHCLAACPEYSTALDTKGVYDSHALINMKHPIKLY